jgi:hypothetical protein
MNMLSNITRSKGDPKVLETGPSSLTNSDRLARMLGWFSIGLGITELVAPRTITRFLGLRGHEGLVRFYGAREIAAGVASLSVDKQFGLWSRVAGDALDIATLMGAMRSDNPRRGNAGLALAMVAGITMLDLIAAKETTTVHARSGQPRDYKDRSGFPKGLASAKGAAKDFLSRANGQLNALPVGQPAAQAGASASRH